MALWRIQNIITVCVSGENYIKYNLFSNSPFVFNKYSPEERGERGKSCFLVLAIVMGNT